MINWVNNCIPSFAFNDLQIELIDLKQSDYPALHVRSHPTAIGIYDQPQQQSSLDKIALADGFIFISTDKVPHLKAH